MLSCEHRPLLAEYKRLRKTLDADTNQLQQIKAEIAWILVQNPALAYDFFPFLNKLNRISSGTNVREIGIFTDEATALQTDPRDPSLYESAIATIDAKKVHDEVLQHFDGLGTMLSLGSLAWAPYYSIRHPDRQEEKPSDIDFEFIFKPEGFDKMIDHLQSYLYTTDKIFSDYMTWFWNKYQEGKVDYCTYKVVMPNTPYFVSIHFTPFPTFKEVCERHPVAQNVYLSECRAQPRAEGYLYSQKRLDQKQVYIDVNHTVVQEETGFNYFSTPLYFVEGGVPGLGYAPNKFLTAHAKMIHFDQQDEVANLLKGYHTNIKKWLATLELPENFLLSEAFSRSDRIHPNLKKRIDEGTFV